MFLYVPKGDVTWLCGKRWERKLHSGVETVRDTKIVYMEVSIVGSVSDDLITDLHH